MMKNRSTDSLVLANMRAHFSGDEEVMFEFIHAFFLGYRLHLDELLKSIDQQDFGLGQRLAHKLRGTLSHFKIDQLQNQTKLLESRCKESDFVGARNALEELNRQLDLLNDELGPALAESRRSS